jgi:hypothetical protein
MIITKVLGLTAALSKSKKVKIGILLLEVAILALAAKSNNIEKKKLN